MSLHGDLELDEYWACERPEAPPEAGIWWDEKCAGCRLAYQVAARFHPTFQVVGPTGSQPITDDPIDEWPERYSPGELTIAAARRRRAPIQ